MNAPTRHDRRQRRLLILVALMFFAPLGVAFYLYYGHGTWHPGTRVNAGELIQPPRPLPEVKLPLLGGGETAADFLTRKWTLLYVGGLPCGEHCRTRLYDMRQVRLALDRDRDRVQRVFIATGECCTEFLQQHPDLITVRESPADAPLLALLGARATSEENGRIYLIDPLGNFMMSYAPEAKAKGLLEDLKRLLRLSHIG